MSVLEFNRKIKKIGRTVRVSFSNLCIKTEFVRVK